MSLLKILTEWCAHKQVQRIEVKNTFVCIVYRTLFHKKYWIDTKKNCIKINGAQKPVYEEGTIKFTNFDKQISIPFKIYAAIECFNKKVNIRKGESTTFYSKHVPYSIGAKLVCIDDTYSLTLQIFFRSNCVNKFLQWVFNQRKWCNQIINPTRTGLFGASQVWGRGRFCPPPLIFSKT